MSGRRSKSNRTSYVCRKCHETVPGPQVREHRREHARNRPPATEGKTT